MQDVLYSIGNSGPVLVKSTFNGYDACINSYVGCEFGCTYCYVRWFVKDDEADWGKFVRLREHIETKLPKELDKGYVRLATGKTTGPDGKKHTIHNNLPIQETRLVLGTMTDPYMPAERKHRITRKALQILIKHSHQFKKVGIFTRSPIVLEDLDLIKQLPNARIHFTITPLPAGLLHKIEPISPNLKRRWQVAKKITDAGIRLHVSVAPVIPLLSEEFTEEFAQQLNEVNASEFFVDPFMPYRESRDAFEEGLKDNILLNVITSHFDDKKKYLEWKATYRQQWEQAWKATGNTTTLPIWSDHENHTWVDMRTGGSMSRREYND